jgi:RimJ/RimL family protein N-acetyltransferase
MPLQRSAAGKPGGAAAKPGGARLLVVTENFRLRSLQPRDVTPRFVEWYQDDDMRAGLNIGPRNWTVVEMQQFVMSFDNLARYIIGIFHKQSETLVGFYTLDVNLQHKTAQMAAGIGEREFWGKNVLIETTPRLVRHLFDFRGIDKVAAPVLAKNRRILFQFMVPDIFTFEGRLHQEVLEPSGKRIDLVLFSALKSPG